MWKKGLCPFSVFEGGMQTVTASCNALLQNENLIDVLKKQNFSVAIVDLLYNECGLALAHHLGLYLLFTIYSLDLHIYITPISIA